MRNIKLLIEYDGTGFSGWQIQNSSKAQRKPTKERARTVQGTLEKALRKVLGRKTQLVASGRTDSGVHAKGQVANFKTNSKIPAENLRKALNGNSPDDVVVLKAEEVSLKFNSRFSAKSKLYRYTILNSTTRYALGRDYFYQVPYRLDVKVMKKETKALLGRRNFKSFKATDKKEITTIRNIKTIDVSKEKDFIYVDIEANGFLYNMARNIVGTLIEVGRGKFPPGSTKRILKQKDRTKAGPTVPAKGLCLMKVKYILLLALLFHLVALPNIGLAEENDPREFNNIGVEYISKDEHKQAAVEFRKALKLDPEFNIARYNLGLALYNSGKTDEAILEFEKLIKKSPYFVNAHYNLGTIYLKGKMHEQAKQVLKRVVELKPKHAEAQLNLGYIYYQEGNLDDAIEAYKKGLEIKPDNLRAHLSLGHIYDKKKMYEEAMVEYNTALQIDPTAEPAKIAVGYMEVIKSLEDNIQDVPDDYLSLIHLGHVYYAKKMYKEAITAYKKALEISPANMVAESAMEKAIVASLEP